MIAVVSFTYHHLQYCTGCYEDPDRYRRWQETDDFAALFVFLVIGVYLLALGQSPAKGIIYFVGAVIIFLERLFSDVQAVVAIGVLLVVALIARLVYDRKSYPYANLDVVDLILSALLAASGLFIFVYRPDDDNLHGLWHVILSLSAYFALDSLDHTYTLLFWRRK